MNGFALMFIQRIHVILSISYRQLAYYVARDTTIVRYGLQGL